MTSRRHKLGPSWSRTYNEAATSSFPCTAFPLFHRKCAEIAEMICLTGGHPRQRKVIMLPVDTYRSTDTADPASTSIVIGISFHYSGVIHVFDNDQLALQNKRLVQRCSPLLERVRLVFFVLAELPSSVPFSAVSLPIELVFYCVHLASLIFGLPSEVGRIFCSRLNRQSVELS